MGSALLAVIQDIQYLLPTRTLYKRLHETEEDLATGLVCLITVRRHPRTRPPVTFSAQKATTLAPVVGSFGTTKTVA